jgi:hypothetical protein
MLGVVKSRKELSARIPVGAVPDIGSCVFIRMNKCVLEHGSPCILIRHPGASLNFNNLLGFGSIDYLERFTRE